MVVDVVASAPNQTLAESDAPRVNSLTMSEDKIIPFSTEKKTVIITGCTRGLGRAMAEGFVKRGDTVVGGGRSADEIEKLNANFGEDGNAFFLLDVTDEDAVEDFCESAIKAVGVPNLVVNNAAVINQNAPLWDVPADEFSEVIDVNIKGVAAIIRHMVPAMIEEGAEGVIVNFSSGWGRATSPEVAPYCATKWAIEGLTQALAQELPPTLGAIALNPGIINTDMLQSCFGPGAGSYPTAADWARSAVPFLANLGPGDNGKSLSAP